MFVLDEIRNGHTLTQACKRQHISRQTVIGLMERDTTLRKMVLDAVAESEDMMADILINIDEYHADPKMAKVISDNIKWLLSRRRATDYGDRMVVEQKSTSQDEAILSALAEAIKRIPMPEQPEDFKVIEAEPVLIATPD